MEKTKFEFILGLEPDVIEAFAKGPMPEKFSEEQFIAQAIIAMGDNEPPSELPTTTEISNFEYILMSPTHIIENLYLGNHRTGISASLVAMGED